MPADPAYRAADPDDFAAMIQPGRYARRSSDFEEIIARTARGTTTGCLR